MGVLRKILIFSLYIVYPLVIFIFPIIITGSPFFYFETLGLKFLWLVLVPVIFLVSFILTAGLLSIPAQKAIKVGKFPRDLHHPVYGVRRLYGLCWTAVYYSGPIYFLCLSIPLLKKMLLRLFGYRGSLDIVVYPDTWIRDLPLLNMEKGVYLANKSTIGTNVCTQNGQIIVGKITLKQGVMIGHLAAVALGSTLEENTEIGVATQVGVGSFIGKNTRLGSNTVIGHYAKIGQNVKIGHCCYIGIRASINDNIEIVSGTVIPDKAIIKLQQDADFLREKCNYVRNIN